MRRSSRESGTVDYTGRAFHQDAMEAMRSDIVRGLIELITNSDDAYASVGGERPGKIRVEVEHRKGQPWVAIVRDRACGMTAEVMKSRLKQLGGRTSGFESGESRRGNLGRGAKDLAAFGEVTFESLVDNEYACFRLHPNGAYDLEHGAATEKERDRLGIPRGNGTVVTVRVQAGIRCPQHQNLARRLATHFQLRDILSDPRRKVELHNLNDGESAPLTYTYPDLREVYRSELEIPGYPDARAELVLWRHPTRHDDGPNETGRPNGILIKGKRAIYDNTLFGLEGEVHAGWFSGKLVCEHIDRLAREYDDRLGKQIAPAEENPVPIISRRRDGLNPDHPFVRALRQAVEKPLGDLVAEEREKARQENKGIESDSTREALDRLARELSRLITEELLEIEAEDLGGSDEEGEGEPPALWIVPVQVFAYMGEERTLTVAARRQGIAVGDEVSVGVDPGGVVELLTPRVPLKAHSRREDILVGQIRVRPLIEGEVAMISASLGHRTADALVEVKPPRVVVEEPVEAPETFAFEKPSYRIGWRKQKELTLIAPADVVAEHGAEVRVSSSDAGVVVRTLKVRLEYDDTVDFYRGSVAVEGRVLHAKSLLTARLGDLSATTHVNVTRKEDSPNFQIRLIPDEVGSFRSTVEREEIDGHPISIIKVWGRHPAIRPYLGEAFEGQNSPVVRAMVSEIVADVSARIVVSELYRLRRTTEDFNADRFYREHYKRVTRFLPRFQKLLIGEPTIARTAEELRPLAVIEVGSATATQG